MNAANDTGVNVLERLAPPVDFIDYVERIWANKQSKGEQVPERWAKWLARWQTIRAGLPSEMDYVKTDEWLEVARLVKEIKP